MLTLPMRHRLADLRSAVARFGDAIDAMVAARAARVVPEWKVLEIHSEIRRYRHRLDAPTSHPDEILRLAA